MKEQIDFTKMHGAGNDFILIDNRRRELDGSENKLFRNLCRRHTGVGADGLMLIDAISGDHFTLKYYNADGKPAEMCGNGARCAVYFASLLKPDKQAFRFSIFDESYRGEITAPEQVRIVWNFTPVIKKFPILKEIIPAEFRRYINVDSGVPHLVLEVNSDLAEVDVARWGKFFRRHRHFAPRGTNVNFIQKGKNGIHIRTYERGVEGETLACGTGAVAAAIAAAEWKLDRFPVNIRAAGGVLKVGIDAADSAFWLEGPVKKVFSGTFNLPDLV